MFLLQTEGVAIIFWIGKTNNVANFLRIVYAFIVTLKCFEYLKNEKKKWKWKLPDESLPSSPKIEKHVYWRTKLLTGGKFKYLAIFSKCCVLDLLISFLDLLVIILTRNYVDFICGKGECNLGASRGLFLAQISKFRPPAAFPDLRHGNRIESFH